MKTPDEICEHYSSENVDLNIYKREGSIIIEASEKGLDFLGQLLISQSKFDKDNGFGIAPNGAGNKLFSRRSKFGLYINRIDE